MESTQGSIKYQRQSSLISVTVSVGVGTEEEETYSEMGERREERNDHPLFNDVILSKLFEFMGGKDLKACRLVCRKWCMSTLPSARSKFSVQLKGNNEEMTRKLTDFVEVFRDNKLGIPFVEYNLYPFCTTEEPGQEFLQICGSTAKIVSLKEKSQALTMELEDISALLKAMPKIEFFSLSNQIHSRSGNAVKLFPDDSSTKPALSFLKKLQIINSGNEKSGECCPTFIEEILSVAPNLVNFKVHDSWIDPDRNRIDQVLKAIETLERASVITNLDFYNAKIEHFESLQKLAEIGLKLKNLDFIQNIQGQEGEKKCLPQLAKLFKYSIECLRVDEVCSSFIQLPYMPKLERLEVGISGDFDSKCVNLNKLFPALMELELMNWEIWEYNDDDEDEWEEFLPNSEPCPNVKSLTLWKLSFKSQVLDHILIIFPNLTKFELHVKTDGVEIIRKVMTQMTQLEDLSLNGTIEGIESIDAFFTGIAVQNIQELEHVVTELKEMTVQLREETIRHYGTQYCQFPSIANLTNLKRLRLNITGGDEFGDDPTRVTRLTDVFVYFGLYSMKHINKLEINNCEFTKSGCEILTTEMELETWTFRDTDYHDIIPQVQ